MFIIWGSSTYQTEEGRGRFICPLCDGLRPYRRVGLSSYFTFFFIPIFPTSSESVVLCLDCGGQYGPEVLHPGGATPLWGPDAWSADAGRGESAPAGKPPPPFKSARLPSEPEPEPDNGLPHPETQMLWVRADLESGSSMQAVLKKLKAAGYNRVTADLIITQVAQGKWKHCNKCGFSYLGSIPKCAGCGGATAF